MFPLAVMFPLKELSDTIKLPATSNFWLGLVVPIPTFPPADLLNNKSPFEKISASSPDVLDVARLNLCVPLLRNWIFVPLPSLSDMICVVSPLWTSNGTAGVNVPIPMFPLDEMFKFPACVELFAPNDKSVLSESHFG